MIALVDCNACYASCEQIFRPDLRGKPVIVLSNNDGCIIARSKEAKQLGIPDLQPYFKLEQQLRKQGVHIFSANFKLYGDISNNVMDTLRGYSKHVEQYSIDEMFLDVSTIGDNYEGFGLLLKNTLWQNVRMPVGVGIAPTKTLAKLANYAAKHLKSNGVAVLDTPEKWQWLQKKLAIKKVWGVGSQLSKRLNALKIFTVYDLAQAEPVRLRKLLNVNVERTIRELNGERCIEIEETQPARKEIFVTRSFGNKTDDKEELLKHISRYASAACAKLRAQNGFTQSLIIFAETSRFKSDFYNPKMRVQLPYPSNDTALIISYAKTAMSKLYKKEMMFNKCGIGLLNVQDRRYYQQDLFEAGQSLKVDKLFSMYDKINKRYGRDTLVHGSEGLTGKWSMHQTMLSPSYTSSWLDLPKIKC